MGKYKDDLKKAGWDVIVTESSTVFSSVIPEELEEAMREANKNMGYLSSGTVIVGSVGPIFVGQSEPSPPYYFKEDSDTYHWETSCATNRYPAPGWKKSNTKPSGREQCTECKAKSA